MIIGNFTYNQAKDTYSGEIQTLTLLRKKVLIRPAESKSEKGPDYRAVAESPVGAVELGAAWKRKSEANREYLSVTLDDPALPRVLNAALMPAEDGQNAILIWSRAAKRKAE
jgi:uncharacterized protein (DUF736 family)